MSKGTDALKEAFRDYSVSGNPATGVNEPDKPEIRDGLDKLALDIAAASFDDPDAIINLMQPFVDAAEAASEEAKAWSSSPTPPDPSDPTSESAKTIAQDMEQSYEEIREQVFNTERETVGRPYDATLVDASAVNNATHVMVKKVDVKPDKLVMRYKPNADGTIRVGRFATDGTTQTCVDSVVINATTSQELYDVPLDFEIGEAPGFFALTRAQYIPLTPADSGGYYRSTTTGFQTSFTQGTAFTNSQPQIGFYFDTEVAANFQDQIDDLDEMTGTLDSQIKSGKLDVTQSQRIGPPESKVLVGSSAVSDRVFIFTAPLSRASIATHLSIKSIASGTVYLKRYLLSGNSATQQGSDLAVVLPAAFNGIIELPMPLELQANEIVGFYGNGIVAFDSSAESSVTTPYYRTDVGSGNAGNVTIDGTVRTTSQPQLGLTFVDETPQTVNILDNQNKLNDLATKISSLMTYGSEHNYKLRYSLGKVHAPSPSGIVVIALTGDSIHQRPGLSTPFRNMIYDKHGNAGHGWINVDTANSDDYTPGYVFTRNGSWTFYDANNKSGAVPPICVGVDGMCISTNGTTGTASLTFIGTKWHCQYYDGDGTFEYQIDGGSWVSVVGANTNALKAINVTVAAGAHTVNFRTSANTGTVTIVGFAAHGEANIGAIVSNHANRGMTGQDYTAIKSWVAQSVNLLPFDVTAVQMVLGTNDSRLGQSLASYNQGRDDLFQCYSQRWSDVSKIKISAYKIGQAEVLSGGLIRDSDYSSAVSGKYSWYNCYDDWPDAASMFALGAFVETTLSSALHCNLNWGESITTKLYYSFYT